MAVYIASNTNNGKRLLQATGLLMVGTYAGITTTGSFAILVPLSILNGMAWSCWPILMTVPFRLPGIRPREVAVALAFIMMSISGGNAAGPLVAGFAQEALGGDVRLTLFLLSFSGISLTVAGTFPPPWSGWGPSPAARDDPSYGVATPGTARATSSESNWF